MNRTRHVLRSLVLVAFALTTAACDSGEEPVQTVEDGVSQEGVDLLVEVAELEPEADFSIYTVALPHTPEHAMAPAAAASNNRSTPVAAAAA